MEKRVETEDGKIIAAYATGTAPVAELNQELANAWRELLEDPSFVADAARMLEIRPEDLRAFDRPPFELSPGEQGSGPVETAVIVFASQVAFDLGKDLAKEAVKEGLKQLWSFIRTKMELKLPLGAFGRETKVEEAGDGPAATA